MFEWQFNNIFYWRYEIAHNLTKKCHLFVFFPCFVHLLVNIRIYHIKIFFMLVNIVIIVILILAIIVYFI